MMRLNSQFRLILEKNVRLKLGAGGYQWQGKGEIRYVDITDEPLTPPIMPSRSNVSDSLFENQSSSP